MRLRRGEPEDAPSIARIMRSTYDRMEYIPRLHTPEEDLAYIGGLFGEREIWVAENDAGVVGFAILATAELTQMHVAPGEQNAGIGSALLARVKERRPAGFSLWTFQKNVGARRFYERHGLDVVLLTEGEGNEEQEPDVQYAWRPG
jgi:GNAT superfamily N-acetyltransferase